MKYCCLYHFKQGEKEKKLTLWQKIRKTLLNLVVNITIIAFFGSIFFVIMPDNRLSDEALRYVANTQYFKGKVESIEPIEEARGQLLRVNMDNNGLIETAFIPHYPNQANWEAEKKNIGSEIIVSKSVENGIVTYTPSDNYRLPSVAWLIVLFILLVVLIAGRKGLNSIFGFIFSLMVVVLFVIPQMLAGNPPIVIAILTSLLIVPVSMIMSQGFNWTTLMAITSTLLTNVITVITGKLASDVNLLTGVADENAQYIARTGFFPEGLKVQDLLLAGIIITTIGILDDITTSQIAAVEEISRANPYLKLRDLFISSMRIGKSHIASLINTLALTLIGASLPLFLVFGMAPYEPLWVLINREYIVVEIIKSLVGSTSLLLAVPISTFTAAYFFTYMHKKNPELQTPEPSLPGRSRSGFSFDISKSLNENQ
jgi:uncharacterized membrane protein